MEFDTFNVETDVLRRGGGKFNDLGSDFAAASKRLQHALEELGEPWADTGFGEVFGQVYMPIRDGIFTSMDSLAERLQKIGDNLQDMARAYEAAETFNSDQMDGLAGQF